ncbi:Pseudechetoxin [Arthrobotrys entomopaga]|nr:Pseudechetoxin [Arthrobotrys entomopaga]
MKFSTLILSTLMGATALAAPVSEKPEDIIEDMIATNGTDLTSDIHLGDIDLIGNPVSFTMNQKRGSSFNGNYGNNKNVNYPAPSNAGDFLPESQYKDSLLAVHNSVRAAHGLQALTWSSSLVNYAQTNTPVCNFAHSTSLSKDWIGENILSGFSAADQMVLNMWYTNELKMYDFNNQGFAHGTGHMTQMVWKATTEVGCMIRKCSFGTYVKCNYRSPGNIQGQYNENVNRPQRQVTYTPGTPTPSTNQNQNQNKNQYYSNNQGQNSNNYYQQGSGTTYSNTKSQPPSSTTSSKPATSYTGNTSMTKTVMIECTFDAGSNRPQCRMVSDSGTKCKA